MPFTGGYIKLHRSLLAWEWADDPETLAVWVHLLLLANFAETKYHGQTIKPGQIVTGRAALAKQTGLTERKIRTILNRLKTTGNLTIESTKQGSVISLVNYRFFQGLDDTSDQRNDRDVDQQATNDRPYNKKKKKAEENGGAVASAPRARFIPPTVEEVREYCTSRGNHVDAQRFCDFYESNGWKVGKNPMKSWKAAVRTWERRDTQDMKGGTNDPYAGYERF